MVGVLFVLKNYFPSFGSLCTYFRNLAEGLVRKGLRVVVVTSRVKNSRKFEIVNGVEVHRIFSGNNSFIFQLFALPKLLFMRGVDLVSMIPDSSVFLGWFVCKVRRKKSVLIVHDVFVDRWDIVDGDLSKFRRFCNNFFEKLIYSKLSFSKFVAISKNTKRLILSRNVSEDRVSVVYNSINYDVWNPDKYDGKRFRRDLGFSDDDFVCLFFGRPGKNKGLEYLIKSMPMIHSEVKNVKLVAFVSDSDVARNKSRKELISLVKELNLEGDVFLKMPCDISVLPGFVKASDCVVVPSLTEGFGFSAVEACAMGVPVVVSDVDSLPEVVSGKFVFVKPGNSESIARGVIKVFNKQFNTLPLKRFDNDTHINGFLKVYSSLLGKRNWSVSL